MTASDALQDLPPSAKLVFKVLDYDGPLTQKQLVNETMLSPRTVRYAIERLETAGVLEVNVHYEDARQRLYALTQAEEAVAVEAASCPSS